MQDRELAFWLFLSTRWGKPVWEMKQILPYAEFVLQIAYYNVYPWGDDWQQAGTAAWASIAASPYVKRRFKPDDFVPRKRMLMKPRQNAQQMKNVLLQGMRKLQEMRSGR